MIVIKNINDFLLSEKTETLHHLWMRDSFMLVMGENVTFFIDFDVHPFDDFVSFYLMTLVWLLCFICVKKFLYYSGAAIDMTFFAVVFDNQHITSMSAFLFIFFRVVSSISLMYSPPIVLF